MELNILNKTGQNLYRFCPVSILPDIYLCLQSLSLCLYFCMSHSCPSWFFRTNIQNKKSFSKSIRSNKRTYPTVCLPFSFIQTRLELIKVKIMSKIAVYHPSSILSPEKIGKYKKEPYICLNIKYQ